MATSHQIRTIYAIIHALKLREMKEDLIMAFTNGRTTHIGYMDNN